MDTEVVEIPESVNERPSVGFPTPPPGTERPKATKWIIAIIGIVVILILGVFFLLMSPTNLTGDASPTPLANGLNTLPTSTPIATPTSTPAPSTQPVNKADVKISILNGTGKSGEASYLQGVLEDMGYEDLTAGNASSQNATQTTVTYSSSLSQTLTDEMTEKLESIYEDVQVKRISMTGDTDIEIVTGPRKGAAAASATPTPKASATPKPSATPES